MLRSSPNRHRHSVGFVPTVYNGTLPPSESHRAPFLLSPSLSLCSLFYWAHTFDALSQQMALTVLCRSMQAGAQ